MPPKSTEAMYKPGDVVRVKSAIDVGEYRMLSGPRAGRVWHYDKEKINAIRGRELTIVKLFDTGRYQVRLKGESGLNTFGVVDELIEQNQSLFRFVPIRHMGLGDE